MSGVPVPGAVEPGPDAPGPDSPGGGKQASGPVPTPAGDDPDPEARHSRGSPRNLAVLILVAAGVLLVAAVVSVRVNDGRNELATSWRGRQLIPPRSRPDFALTDTSGQRFDFRERTAGKLTFLFFGYTNCPDLCPTHMAALTGALPNARDREATVIFVTTDPERDTPVALREWLNTFGSDVVGLTGTPQQIGVAQTAAGIASPTGTAPDSDGGYSVVHASQAIMFTPDDLTHIEYPFGTTRADWSADLELLSTRPDWMRA